MGRIVGMVLLAPLAVSCWEGDVADCQPTNTTAEAAEKVSVGDPGSSGRLSARLVSEGKPLRGMTMRFEVLDGDESVYTDEATAGDDGIASVEHVGKLDPAAVEGIARGDAWRATFDGNERYCSSEDRAPFSTVGG